MDRYNNACRRLKYQSTLQESTCTNQADPITSSVEHDEDLLPIAEALLDLSTPGPSEPRANSSPITFSTPVTPSEREMLYSEMNALRAERDAAFSPIFSHF